MAHKTFISYKYSEAQNLRDRIKHWEMMQVTIRAKQVILQT